MKHNSKVLAKSPAIFGLLICLIAPLLTACGANTATSAPNAPASPTSGQPPLTTVAASITKANGAQVLMTVELARTTQEQETGLMGRTSLPEDRGMLFMFEQAGRVPFWMKDTPLALSIAFIDTKGKIVDIQDMQPFSEDTHAPGQDYIYALEVPKGYFAAKGVRAGDLFNLK
jgi:uncharacterized protein